MAWSGTRLGAHEGGETPFHFDVTSRLRPSGNRLVVRVLNPDRSGRLVAETVQSVTIPASGASAELKARVEDVHPWSPQDPYLYRATVELDVPSGGHRREVRTGFREFLFREGYFRLNGKRIFLRGTHSVGHFPVGMHVPPDPELLRRELIYVKTMGFNTVRWLGRTMFPQLDLCDELGLMVYQESYASWRWKPSPQMPERFDSAVREMVLRDRNHPALVAWGLLNETADGPIFRHLVAMLPLVHSLDPTRMVLLSSGRWDGQPDAVRLWTVPRAGKIRISGEVVNRANRAVPGGGRSFRMGTSSYAPWNALLDRGTGQGIFIGWDYFGRWASEFRAGSDGIFRFEFHVAGHRQVLRPGESLTVPQAFVGLFQRDLDNAGNECLDWQYRYMWDYTREGWFPAIRMLGWWWNGTPWQDPGNTWVGGNGDQASAFRKIFRVADLMSQVGADVYHRDWGWWDRAGDWGGPDFRTTGEYLRKRGMGQLIYAFIYTVDSQSRVAREHPDWVIKQTLDMSKPEVVEHLKFQLDDFARRFGPFEWRNDSTPTVPHDSDDTPLLAQDRGFRQILRGFLDNHPDCAFQAVNGGGNDAGYDYARYASAVSFSDGAVGIIRNYWASLILPPDKSSDIPDIWQPDQYDKAIWRGLLTINFDMTGDTWDPAKLEGLRELIDIYHYLHQQGVAGRWVKVYRPAVTGDDPTMYFERLSGDGRRGILIPKRPAAGGVVIKPKGLVADTEYLVSFHESSRSETRTGAGLMEHGIRVEKMAPGELIYLNLPYHPGSRLYKTLPSAPHSARKRWASYLGYPGVEVAWSAGTDEHWVSYYEVLRDGVVIDKVAKGTFYFDHSASADLAARYEIRTVNGGGMPSRAAVVQGPEAQRAQIVDDASGVIAYSGAWQQQKNLPAAHAGTIHTSSEKGAAFEFAMDGSTFTWFSKLCNECGKAEVRVDGSRDAVVDTYSADEIFGVGVYSKNFDRPGRHRIRIVVIGEHGGPRGKGTQIHVDGVRIGR